MKNRIHSFTTRNSFRTSRNIFQSFKYAFNGIVYCFKFTRNFRIELILGSLSIIFSFVLKLNANEYIILSSTIFSVLMLELLNTSIESLVDLTVEKNFNKLAKVAKDCSSASVLLASVNSIFVAVYLFFPKIKLILNNL